MKKIPAAAVILLLFLSACKKDLPLIGDLSPYQIKTFRMASIFGYYDTLTFTYTRWGDPLTVNRPFPNTGAPDFSFRYDNEHRLTDFIGNFGPNPISALFWHKYIYTRGLITTDSVYINVHIVNGQRAEYTNSYSLTLEYDKFGRVIRQYMSSDSLGPLGQQYSYDARGNLINGASYDNKLSFRRTSWVWMFLDRDFSVNNAFHAYSYNAGGLPVHFIPFPRYEGGGGQFIYQNDYTEGWITWQLP